MKRFKVETKDGHTLMMYYPDIDHAYANHPTANISEYTEQPHVKYIEQMFNCADEVCSVTERKGSTVYLLRFSTSVGTCYATLHKDISDGIWYDLCEYRLQRVGATVVPVLRTLSNPKEFCLQFISSKPEYTILCVGRKVSRPKELKGVQKFASIPFMSRRKSQLFLNGSDLFMKHPDYFSPEYCKPEDRGTPLSYRAKKYGVPAPKEKFIYEDNWGAIVLRREAWIKISNFCFLVRHLNNIQVSTAVWSLMCQYHSWPKNECNTEWSQFLEAVAGATREYLLNN